MAIDKALHNRIEQLIARSRNLRRLNQDGQASSEQQMEECVGWIAAARHAIQAASGGAPTAYSKSADRDYVKEYG